MASVPASVYQRYRSQAARTQRLLAAWQQGQATREDALDAACALGDLALRVYYDQRLAATTRTRVMQEARACLAHIYERENSDAE